MAQPRDGDLKRLASRCRRGLAPKRVNDLFGGYDLIGVKEKEADKHSLAVPANVERTALAAHLEGTENPKVHGVPL